MVKPIQRLLLPMTNRMEHPIHSCLRRPGVGSWPEATYLARLSEGVQVLGDVTCKDGRGVLLEALGVHVCVDVSL